MLALIPARGGSKGLPGKNLRPLAGKPLIAHTILAARAARSITRVVVTTDDQAIAEAARAHGAEVPFLRPAELAQDTSNARDAYLHACVTLEAMGSPPISSLVVLLATAPLRTGADIDAAVATYHAKDSEAVISVAESAHPPHWTKTIDAAGVLRAWLPAGAPIKGNRQENTPTYMPNGAIYVLSRIALEREEGYYGNRTHPFIMPRSRSIDIDDLYDFQIAEFLLGAARTTLPAEGRP